MSEQAVQTPVGVPATPQPPVIAPPAQAPEVGVPATPNEQSVAPATAPVVTPDELEARYRAKAEQDVARVKAAEQRRAAELQKQLMAERQARLQLEQQQVQRAMQQMTPEERSAFQQRMKEQEIANRAAELEKRENILRQQGLVEAAKKYKAELVAYYSNPQYFGVPVEKLDQSSPDAMHKSALLYLRDQARHAQTVAQMPAPTQVTATTGGAVSPGGVVSQLRGMTWAERQKFYAQQRNQK